MAKIRVQILTEGQPVRYHYPPDDETPQETLRFFMNPTESRIVVIPLGYPSKSKIVLNQHQLAKTIFILEEINENTEL
jgi:hypothetical protein